MKRRNIYPHCAGVGGNGEYLLGGKFCRPLPVLPPRTNIFWPSFLPASLGMNPAEGRQESYLNVMTWRT